MKNKYILFDFDGVIVDSFRPAFEVQKMICPHLTETEYRKRFEGNINDWKTPINTHTEKCRHDINFFAEYVPRMEKVKIVPGMETAIDELRKKYTLIVISSTITSPIKELLERNALADYFVEVMGNDVHKSKVEKMKMVFSKYGCTPNECVFITDTLGDMKEAVKAGVGSVGVTWGFNDPETLLRGNPFRLVSNTSDLHGTIADYFTRTH